MIFILRMNDKITTTYDFRVMFENSFDKINASKETKAYLASLFFKMLKSSDENDLSKESIVLTYLDARLRGEFDKFRKIGDYVTWTATIFPENISYHYDMVVDIAASSYHSCWKMLNRKWALYEELGDHLPRIIEESRKQIDFL